MNRRTENRLIGALSAVVVAGLIVLVACVALALTRGDSGATIGLVAVSPTADPSQAANHEPKPFDSNVATPIPLADGIYGGSQAPYPAEAFMSENMWVGRASGLRVLVYAGAEGRSGRDPQRGLLMVDTYSDQVPGGSYLAPSGVGPLQIVGYEGALLEIQAATGETFYFDAETRTFTDADGNPVPTDTPTPTPIVYPTNNSTLPPLPIATPVPTVTPTSAPLATAQPNAG